MSPRAMRLRPSGPNGRRRPAVGAMALDAAAWSLAAVAALALRLGLPIAPATWWATAAWIGVLVVLHLAIGHAAMLHRGRHRTGSLSDVRLLATVMALTAAIGTCLLVLVDSGELVPRSLVAIAAPIALVLAASGRLVERLRRDAMHAATADPGVERAVVYGAGALGELVVRQMRSDAASPLRAVAVVDDDPDKRHVAVEGVRVRGTSDDLERIASATGATTLVVAVARADAEALQRITTAAEAAGLAVKVFPSLREVLDGRTRLADLRDVSMSDLIGRRPIDTEIEHVASYLRGARVLVTGAGGSIGAELCAQIDRFGPAELIMLDRDETMLQTVQLALRGHGLLDSSELVLADVRDAEALRAIFLQRRPEVVFHAAALKHLTMLERHPDEAWKTNVLGTRNVLDAAAAAGASIVVNVSTDKAANPTSVLGRSKRLAERLTAWQSASTGMRCISVRFGNVLGSRGSMLPIFARLIDEGRPITLTDAEATRYFMTIPEACQLVVQAGGIGRGGEVLVLDMGEPVRILDVAQRMIALSGRRVQIAYTGLRPGEKLHEELLGLGERDERPLHPLISHTSVPPLAPRDLADESVVARVPVPPRIDAGRGVPVGVRFAREVEP